MKIKPRHVFVLALMGSWGACAAGGANAGLDSFNSSLAPLSPNPDYQLTVCKETESTGDPRSALRAVDPAGNLIVYLENHKHRKFAWNAEAAIKLSLLEGPTHGKLASGITDGQTYYGYNAEPNYVGNDKAVFMAEFEGKRYKIVVNLVVSLTVGETPLMSSEKPVCPPWKLIKVNGKSV